MPTACCCLISCLLAAAGCGMLATVLCMLTSRMLTSCKNVQFVCDPALLIITGMAVTTDECGMVFIDA